MATRGRRCTVTLACPVAARAAMAGGPTRLPWGRTRAPRTMSLPARRMLAPVHGYADGHVLRQRRDTRRSIGVLDGHDRVGAGRHDGARQDAHGRARLHAHRRLVTGGHLADHRQARRANRDRRPPRRRRGPRSRPWRCCPMAAASAAPRHPPRARGRRRPPGARPPLAAAGPWPGCVAWPPPCSAAARRSCG